MKNNRNPVIFYHGQCPDGFGAALAAWLVYGDEALYVPATHGETVPEDMTGKDVFILDYCFPPDVMSRLDQEATSVTVLDHHKSSQDAMGTGRYSCKCHLHFDLERSGAVLAWNAFHPGKPVPSMFQHIMDRDLWQWKLPQSAEFLYALDAVPFEFPAWAAVLEHSDQERQAFIDRGTHMRDKFLDLSRKVAAKAHPITLLGVPGLAVNAPSEFASDVGEMLYEQSKTFAAIWRIGFSKGHPILQVSMRGCAGFDCLPIAKAFGGGGHPEACAFRLPLASLGKFLAGSLEPVA